MPIMPPRRKVSTDNSGVNALISFLGLNDSDPAQASMDLVNPAVGMVGRMAKRAARQIPRHVQQAINKSKSETVFDVAKRFEELIAMLKAQIDALDSMGQGSVRQRFALQDAEKELSRMKGDFPPPKKLMPIEVEDLERARTLPKNATDLTSLFDHLRNRNLQE